MWKLFKTKEEKQQSKQQKIDELQKQVEQLNIKYKGIINSVCKVKDYVFVLKGFKYEDGCNIVKMLVKDKNTPTDCVTLKNYDLFEMAYGIDLTEARSNWLIFRNDLEKLGIELKLLNNE